MKEGDEVYCVLVYIYEGNEIGEYRHKIIKGTVINFMADFVQVNILDRTKCTNNDCPLKIQFYKDQIKTFFKWSVFKTFGAAKKLAISETERLIKYRQNEAKRELKRVKSLTIEDVE